MLDTSALLFPFADEYFLHISVLLSDLSFTWVFFLNSISRISGRIVSDVMVIVLMLLGAIARQEETQRMIREGNIPNTDSPDSDLNGAPPGVHSIA